MFRHSKKLKNVAILSVPRCRLGVTNPSPLFAAPILSERGRDVYSDTPTLGPSVEHPCGLIPELFRTTARALPLNVVMSGGSYKR